MNSPLDRMAGLTGWEIESTNGRELLNLWNGPCTQESTTFPSCWMITGNHRQLKPPRAWRLRPSGGWFGGMFGAWPDRKCGKNLTKTAETLGAARNTVRKYLGKG